MTPPTAAFGIVETWEGLLAEHRNRYPRSTERDWYKLAHQSVLGPGHLMGLGARTWLRGEFDQVEAVPGRLYEPIGILEPRIRLHLGPAKAEGITVEMIWEAMEDHGVQGIPKAEESALPELLQRTGTWLREVDPRTAEAFEEFAEQLAGLGYPPAHHSEEYRTAYRPAYRVVLRLAGLIGNE